MGKTKRSLEHRLRTLEAREGIRNSVYAYALAGDRANDPAIMASLFTSDAVYEAVGMGRFTGREAIVSGLVEIARSAVAWAFHEPGGPLIRLADDALSASAFWWVWCPVRLVGDGADAPHWGAGHYNADLVDHDGMWKFTRLVFETRLRTPFGGPWTEIDGTATFPNVNELLSPRPGVEDP